MSYTNAENQQNWRNRQKRKKEMELELGEDLEDGVPPIQGTLTPLEYMLKIMNDPNEPKDLRARMAVAAAPYLHERADTTAGKKTKKEEKQEAAEEASEGKFAPVTAPRLVA